MPRKTLSLSFLLIILSTLPFFLYKLDFPPVLNFDELHYVPSAREINASLHDTTPEHPPLAKQFIALSLRLIGDEPYGWRLPGSLLGLSALLALFLIALELFGMASAAWSVVALSFLNSLILVQSRIAMTDTYMFPFLMWALAFLFIGLRSPRFFYASGLCFGLALACKWYAVVVLALAPLLLFYEKRLHLRSILPFVVLPLAIYVLSFLPFAFAAQDPLTFAGFFERHAAMLAKQNSFLGQHPGASEWWQWPLLLKPTWFGAGQSMNPDGSDVRITALALIGNPLILLSGLAAWFYCVYVALRTRARVPLLIAVAYALCYFSWMLIPRKVSYAYYYVTAATLLSFALTYVFERYRWLRPAFFICAVLIFLFQLPLSLGLELTPQELQSRIWFAGWSPSYLLSAP